MFVFVCFASPAVCVCGVIGVLFSLLLTFISSLHAEEDERFVRYEVES